MAGSENREADHYGRVIRVRDETYERLQRWAEPLGDTSDSTVARVLDAAEEQGPRFPDQEWLLKIVRRFTGGLPAVAEGDRMPLPVARRLVAHIMGSARPR
jgi:hypothetical protein